MRCGAALATPAAAAAAARLGPEHRAGGYRCAGGREARAGQREPADPAIDGAGTVAREAVTGAAPPHRPPVSPLLQPFAPFNTAATFASHLRGSPPFRSHPPLPSKSPCGVSRPEDSASPPYRRFPRLSSSRHPHFHSSPHSAPNLWRGMGTHRAPPGSGAGDGGAWLVGSLDVPPTE